jgi:hypothetical protein
MRIIFLIDRCAAGANQFATDLLSALPPESGHRNDRALVKSDRAPTRVSATWAAVPWEARGFASQIAQWEARGFVARRALQFV